MKLTYAFIAIIEGNKKNKGGGLSSTSGGGIRQYLEEEAIECFKNWRKNGGVFKNIPIYAICCTNNLPSQKTIDVITNEYNVTYIEKYMPISNTFPAGWWNVPLCGKWFENNLLEDVLIHTDLDLIPLREITQSIIDIDGDNIAKCATYSTEYPDDEKISNDYDKLFVTCFIASYRKKSFYTLWYNKMIELWENWDYSINTDWGLMNIEEHAVDVLYYENSIKIEQVHRVQIGPGYDKVADYSDDELNEQLFFIHRHFNDLDITNNEFMQYIKRRLKQ